MGSADRNPKQVAFTDRENLIVNVVNTLALGKSCLNIESPNCVTDRFMVMGILSFNFYKSHLLLYID